MAFSMSKPILFFTLGFFLMQLVLATPADLSKRSPCYQDNCLRALERNGAQASSFCVSYMGKSPLPTATYTSVCTENPTAVASACSCLSKLQTTTTTTTTSATPSPTQCDAAHNYGYIYQASSFDFKSLYIYYNTHNVRVAGDCCRACLSTQGCYVYIETLMMGGTPPLLFCELGTVGAGMFPGVSAQCPRGVANVTLPGHVAPERVGATDGAGPGPCGAISP